MTGQNVERSSSRLKAGTPTNGRRVTRAVREEKFLHLVRLAWDLDKRGVRTLLELPPKHEPLLVIPRATEPVRVMALSHKGTWFFTWGRGASQRALASKADSVDRIWEAAQ